MTVSSAPTVARQRPPRRPLGGRSALRLFGPPLVAFGAAQFALWVATRASGYRFFSSVSWNRFDSDFYVSIAQAGYSVAPCGPTRPPGTWCGNSGWFPGYPLVTSLPVQLGAPARPAALLVSLACCLGALMLIWIGFLHARASVQSWLCLLLAAFAPGQIYYHTIFPLALAGLALLLVIFFLGRKQWLAAGLAGAVLAATYPSGSLIIPVTAVWLLLRPTTAPWRTRLLRVAQTSGVAALGGVFVLVIQRVQTGYADAFFKVHDHYNNHFQDPFPALVSLVKPVFHEPPTVQAIPHYEAAFAAVLVVMLCGAVIAGRGRAGPLDSLLVLLLLTYWLFPLSISHMDLYRSDALLIPAALLLRRVVLPLQIVAVACGAALSVPMAEAFLVRVLG
jgi:hypothetical protein